MNFAWYFVVYHWLELNGFYRDILASVIGLGAARTIAARPLRGVKASQARQEDLLDTKTPGGLAEVHAELKALRHLLSDTSETSQGHEDEDETPEMDDKDKGGESSGKRGWLTQYRRSRKGHGGAGVPEAPREPPHFLPPGHR
jgi:hypothetical protein